MKTHPVVPAAIETGADGAPWSTAFGDRYRPAGDAFAQARHVFLAGNGLPARWRGRERFTVVETGFGLGHNFLATWDAWRADPARSDRLDFVSIEKHPPTRDALASWHAASALPGLAAQLVAAWPPLAPTLHALHFDDRRVRLLLAFGDVDDWLPELLAPVDACFLDGFAPARNPAPWRPSVFNALARLCVPGATAATWSAARVVRDGLAAAGFEVRPAAGSGGKRDVTLATYAPRFAPKRAPARIGTAATAERRALIVGAGLAGCASAWALAEHGWTTRVVDRWPGIARGTSGNAGGLFHGVVHPGDGPHARFGRAALLHATDAVRVAIAGHGVAGEQAGALRIDPGGDPDAMRERLAAAGLPADCVQALAAADASRVAGLPLDAPAWWYPGGGWVDPAGLARSFVERAVDAVDATRVDGGIDVAALVPGIPGGRRWRAIGTDGRTIDEADVVIVAGGVDAARLAGVDARVWPLDVVRGQTTVLDAATPGLRLPRVPLAGDGYVLPALPGGFALCGATHDPGDDQVELRDADHRRNLARLARLTGSPVDGLPAAALSGRVGLRSVAADRLPLIGAVPAGGIGNATSRLDRPRFVPRAPGLYVHAAFASRGIAWAALGAQALASVIAGGACPVEASLLDAVDAARFVSRRMRRGG